MRIGPMRVVNHRWIPGDIVGGSSALNLVNTVSGWNHGAIMVMAIVAGRSDGSDERIRIRPGRDVVDKR